MYVLLMVTAVLLLLCIYTECYRYRQHISHRYQLLSDIGGTSSTADDILSRYGKSDLSFFSFSLSLDLSKLLREELVEVVRADQEPPRFVVTAEGHRRRKARLLTQQKTWWL